MLNSEDQSVQSINTDIIDSIQKNFLDDSQIQKALKENS
jgi:hypothetical protein